MNQTLLFSIGAGVLAVTIIAALMCGYYAFTRAYDAELAKSVAYRKPDESGVVVNWGIADTLPAVLSSNP